MKSHIGNRLVPNEWPWPLFKMFRGRITVMSTIESDSPIYRKPLEIEAWFQRTTNRKWPMGNRIVTWPIKGQVVIPIGLSLMPNIENCWRCYLATIIAIRAYCCEAVRSAIAIWLLQLAMLYAVTKTAVGLLLWENVRLYVCLWRWGMVVTYGLAAGLSSLCRPKREHPEILAEIGGGVQNYDCHSWVIHPPLDLSDGDILWQIKIAAEWSVALSNTAIANAIADPYTT